MNAMIVETQKMQQEHKISVQNLANEKQMTEIELGSIEQAFRDMKHKYEDMKIIHEGFRKASLLYYI